MKTLIGIKSQVEGYHNILANCHFDVATVYPSKQCCKQDTCQCPVSAYSSFHDTPTDLSIQRYHFFLLRSGTIRDTVEYGNGIPLYRTKGCISVSTWRSYNCSHNSHRALTSDSSCMTCVTDTTHLQNASSQKRRGVWVGYCMTWCVP